MSELDFDKILQEHRGAYHNGHLKFQSSSFSFKNKKTNKTEQIQNEEIDKACWLRRAKGYCFKIMLKNGNNYMFDGFAENDYAKLDDYFNRHLKKSVEKQDMALKGWNWGKTNFQGDVLKFEIENKTAFEIPLKNVSNTNATKNEAVLQFHQNDDAAVSLMEIRFHIPQNTAAGEENTDTAQEFIKSVLAKADLQSVSDGDSICTLTELNCVTPRGRYDVKFFTDFMDLHGKTFDYKISYEHILRLFLLPHKDGRQMYFVIAMDPPIKQGNTRYPFLIFLFNIDDEIDVELNISEKTKEKFGERIEKLSELSGPYHEVVSRICRIVLDKKITVPGNFTTSSGAKCYSCSYKAQIGFLYPLERGFIFVNKPAMHILFSDISMVKLDRSNQGTRSFDFEIENVNGSKYLFSGIDKAEQERLQEFVTQKGIKIAKSDKAFKQSTIMEDDSHHDGYAERMKAEGRRQQDDDDDDDDDEEDEDFEGESESEDDIEFDSDASIETSSDEDDSDSDKKKKKKDKSPKKKESPVKDKKSSKSSKETAASTSSKRKAPETSKDKSSNNKKTKSPVKNEPKSAEFVESDSDSD